MNDKRSFTLHLPGLLKVLAEHLYSSKKVGVRELLQNAHDSCTRRKIEADDPHYRPRIELALNAAARTLTIRDNGCGLTAEEIETYLATIGRGYTRELRERLALDSPEQAAELIGQFGLGFLSAFLLASEVTVTTRSFKGGPALRWQSRGDEYYDLRPHDMDVPIGTAVELQIKPAASFILHERNLIETVRMYTDFLPVPIHLEGDPQPLNLQTPPWESDDPEAATSDYIARASNGVEPICVIPLRDWKVRLDHDSITIPLQGYLFVPPASLVSVREYGDLSVYIRRMFICDGERDLLPPWARFVRGVIDCPVLQPTASREGLHQEENFESVRQALEEQLSHGLRDLARKDTKTWKALVRGHSSVIISWAVKDNEFYEHVKDLVPFHTSRGMLTLPEYLNVTNGTLYYITRDLGALQDQLLAEGRDVPAIDASWFAVEPFLEKYAHRHPDVGLVQLDSAAHDLMRPAPEGPFAALLEYYRAQGIRAKLAVFKPAELPAVMLYPDKAEIARQAGEALRANELPGPLAGLVSNYVNERLSDDDKLGTFYLNAACPLLRRLVDNPPEKSCRAAVLTLLLQTARLFSGRMLDAREAARAFGVWIGAVDQLL